jgi:ADP-heptose:LPS heptosyltransferase
MLIKLPWLWFQRYDAVLDLQNHRISKVVRRLTAAAAWSAFDQFSPMSAGERTRQTIEALWTWKITLATSFQFKDNHFHIEELLKQHGWKSNHELAVLNPAGYSPSRSWPTNHYIEFAKVWLEYNELTQFVLLLLPTMQAKANAIVEALGTHCINLTGKANQVEAFAILQKCKFVLSEDSGLIHMAWVQGIPTLALFSSSSKDWSAPQGERSYCLDSSDLECGPCMLEVCKFGDNRCLVRYAPEFVLDKANLLLSIKH